MASARAFGPVLFDACGTAHPSCSSNLTNCRHHSSSHPSSLIVRQRPVWWSWQITLLTVAIVRARLVHQASWPSLLLLPLLRIDILLFLLFPHLTPKRLILPSSTLRIRQAGQSEEELYPRIDVLVGPVERGRASVTEPCPVHPVRFETPTACASTQTRPSPLSKLKANARTRLDPRRAEGKSLPRMEAQAVPLSMAQRSPMTSKRAIKTAAKRKIMLPSLLECKRIYIVFAERWTQSKTDKTQALPRVATAHNKSPKVYCSFELIRIPYLLAMPLSSTQ